MALRLAAALRDAARAYIYVGWASGKGTRNHDIIALQFIAANLEYIYIR